MEIHATTTYDYEVIRDFMRYTMLRNQKTNRIKLHIPVLVILLLFAGILEALAPDGLKYFSISYFNAAVIVLLYLYIYFWKPKRAFKENYSQQLTVIKFAIKENTFSLSANGSLSNYSGEHSYNSLFKVCETPKYYYLFFKPNQAYILRKTGIIDGTPEQIRAILHNYIPKKKYFIKK